MLKQVYLQQIKKKAKAEGKTCHAKTMLNLDGKTGLVPGLVPGCQGWNCLEPWHKPDTRTKG
jgi:hypothetical protein